MDANRLDAVALITGAGSGIGAAVARDIARRSDGGLILVDYDEAALTAVADDLEQNNVAPERVSMLAFDVADEERWAQAAAFIRAQYGRIDWALLNAGDAPPARGAPTDLLDWGRPRDPALDGVQLALRSLMPLMSGNIRGGSIVASARAAALKAGPSSGLLQLMRAAAKDGAANQVRINAIAPGGTQAPKQPAMPWFHDLLHEKGSERAAFEHIAGLTPPLAGYAGADDVARLILMLLSDDNPITGATFVVC